MASTLRLCAQLSAARLVSRDVPPSHSVQRSLPASGSRSAGALLCRTAFVGGSLCGGHGSSEPTRLISRFVAKAAMGCELAPKEAPEGLELATFAGGCFWGLELAMQRAQGVVKTTVGYTQGSNQNPTYEAVCSGSTGHAEAVQVTYDPKETSFKELLVAFYAQTDPTQLNAQGNDVGTQYRSGIYYHNDDQKTEALESLASVQESIDKGTFRRVRGKKVVVEVLPAKDYYIAEGYHQQYLAGGGRFGMPQSAEKGCKDPIRCYG